MSVGPGPDFVHALEQARSRCAGAGSSTQTLRIRTLGQTEVRNGADSLAGSWLDRRPGQLFKYLIAERARAVKVDEIGESIWPDSGYAISANVRYYVHVLRRLLDPHRPARSPCSFVVYRSGGYALNLSRIWLDADEFERAIEDGLRLLGSDRFAAIPAIEAALDLYGGDFLADEPYATWAAADRQRLHELACEGLSALAEVRLSERRLQDAGALLSRLASMQPYDEDVHRRLIELDLMRGRRTDAMRRYATLRSRLRRHFGEDPSFTPVDLARRAEASS